MARVKRSSRRAMLLAAFMGVMSGTGGFLGAICGVVLALFIRSVFNLAADTTYLMAISVLVGALAALLLSIAMVAPRSPVRVARQARIEVQAQVERL